MTKIQELETKIVDSYTNGVSMDQAESLAGEFLAAQLEVSRELMAADLDSRMRKTGVKSIRAALYINACKTNDKKPTEAAIAASIDSDDIVVGEQNRLDEAEVKHAELKRVYDVFGNAHVHYRTIAKGSFNG